MSNRIIDFSVRQDQLNQVVLDLAATEKEVAQAMASTVNKISRWLKSESVKGLAPHLQIPISVLRRRLKNFRIKKIGDRLEVKVWYGLNPISFIRLKPKRTSSGIVASGRSIDGGFVGTGKSGNLQVFKRTGRGRLPIESQYLDINDKAIQFIDSHLFNSSRFEALFFETFEKELAWRTHKQK
jgi:hypothetical protein